MLEGGKLEDGAWRRDELSSAFTSPRHKRGHVKDVTSQIHRRSINVASSSHRRYPKTMAAASHERCLEVVRRLKFLNPLAWCFILLFLICALDPVILAGR